MAAKVYTCPEALPEPSWEDFEGKESFDTEGYFAATKKHQEEMAEWCRETGKGDLRGEVMRFPVADGKATYMVWKEDPLELIWLDYADGYEADDLMFKGMDIDDVRVKIGKSKRLAELFSSKK